MSRIVCMKLVAEDLLSVPHLNAHNLEVLKEKPIKGVSTDTRTIKKGDLFIALRGEKFDSNEFIAQAFERGAVCAIVEQHANVGSFGDRPHLVVEDSVRALGSLANTYRKKFSLPIIAVAGSNGKTTTKEMIAAVLKTEREVLSTKGNLNNHIGVPLTIFQLTDEHEIAVVEVGTNHFGELEYLCQVLEPTHGLITNIGNEHLEFFGDVQGVAKAEGELFAWLGKHKGVGFVNGDDRFVVRQAHKLRKKVSFGFSQRSGSIRGKLLSIRDNGCVEFNVWIRGKKEFPIKPSLPGKHVMANTFAAAVVGLTFNVPPAKIQRSLAKFKPVSKRMEILHVGGVTIINDTYNANLDSMIAALETLSVMKTRGKKIAILGDMLELGEAAADSHRKVGAAVKQLGIKYLLTFGPASRRIMDGARGVRKNQHCSTKEDLYKKTASLVAEGDIVLVKGSRGMTMEDVVNFLKHTFETKKA